MYSIVSKGGSNSFEAKLLKIGLKIEKIYKINFSAFGYPKYAGLKELLN